MRQTDCGIDRIDWRQRARANRGPSKHEISFRVHGNQGNGELDWFIGRFGCFQWGRSVQDIAEKRLHCAGTANILAAAGEKVFVPGLR